MDTQHFRPSTLGVTTLLFGSLLLNACSSTQQSDAAKVDITITSQVTPDMQPADQLTEVSKKMGRFMVYMYWHDIPTRRKGLVLTEADPITYTLRLHDGNGKEVSNDVHTLEPDSDEALSFALHEFTPTEATGQWSADLEWHGKHKTKAFTVTP